MGGALTPGAPAGTDGPRAELLAVLDELAAARGRGAQRDRARLRAGPPRRPVAIIGSMKPERIDGAATRALNVQLDRTDCYRIIEASDGVPLP